MAVIRPFQAVRYSSDRYPDPGRVLAPPYDIIDATEQAALYDQDDYNIVRLILGKQFTTDSDSDNRYTRAKHDYEAWRTAGVLTRDVHPGFYWMTHRYVMDGLSYELSGLLGVVKLGPFGDDVLAHENTLAAPIADRLDLMKATSANLSPVFTLIEDPGNTLEARVKQTQSQRIAVATVGTDHITLDRISHPGDISLLSGFFDHRKLFVADGHHRYTTALAFRDYWMAKGNLPAESQVNYTLVFITRMTHPGLHLLPTHRIVRGMPNLNIQDLLEKVTPYFDITPLNSHDALTQALTAATVPTIGLVGKNSFFALSAGNIDKISAEFGPEKTVAYRGLDVAILHQIIFTKIFGWTDADIAAQTNLIYVKSADAVVSTVQSDPDCAIGFIMNPTRVDQLRDVSLVGEKMPQKSTYFYPKLMTGLVINPIDPTRSILP